MPMSFWPVRPRDVASSPTSSADELVRHRLLDRYDPHVRRRRSQRARRHAALRYRAHDKLMRALLYDDFSDGHIRSIPPAQSQRQTSLLDTNA